MRVSISAAVWDCTCNDVIDCSAAAQVCAVISVGSDDGVLVGGRCLQTHDNCLLTVISGDAQMEHQDWLAFKRSGIPDGI